MIKTYNELILLNSFAERFDYLKRASRIGDITFGKYRYLVEAFYHSYEWKRFRKSIILRDNACDLGIAGLEITDLRNIFIHHIESITLEDLINKNLEILLNPDNAISCSFHTHNAIHYGSTINNDNILIERHEFDTCPWKKRSE